ncbi:hypothetical protein SLEP1_g39716 [Rubroshorea leprosula]|uniref:Box C/D snoRNA protein 1 n=1 Tax=Rubroshorea leprosula TaxID=152421 RepID=A0AAV5L1Q0_9ROSI|nr:hypothetical protein SLEP1_g39716 [Rubroshorea leprosula]
MNRILAGNKESVSSRPIGEPIKEINSVILLLGALASCTLRQTLPLLLGHEAEASTNPKPMAKEPAFCEECKNHPSKYKCPGCSLRSCSLPCVKAHKQRTGCNGKRNMTKFVPLSEFDDNLLISAFVVLLQVVEQSYGFNQVGCRRGKRIKLGIIKGRSSSHGQLSGDFTQQMWL